MKQTKVKVKKNRIERVNKMRIDDHFFDKEFLKPDKVYEVVEERRDINMTKTTNFRSGVPTVKQNILDETVYYVILTDNDGEQEFLADDFEEV